MRLLKIVPDNTNFGFVRLRWFAFGFTLLLTIAALALVAGRGLNMGVDFDGGLMIEAQFQQQPQLDRVRAQVNALGVGEVRLQQFGRPEVLSIRLPLPESEVEGATNAVVRQVQTAIVEAYPGTTFPRTETVSGRVSQELVRDGILAVVLAIIGIAMFSWFRFEWQFGLSTAVGIVHDVIVTLGFFALTQMEFDLNIVAAILTIVGYSINDKIVIDDRIRENLRKYRQMDIRELIDLSVNETLPRTVMTTMSLVLALGALLIWGGDVIRGFSAAMLLGILVGTYSSIYVSSSLLISLGVGSDAFNRKAMAATNDRAERVGPRP